MNEYFKNNYFKFKEHFHLDMDVKNFLFYKKIKNIFSKSFLLASSTGLSFLLSYHLLGSGFSFNNYFFTSIIFFPLFLSLIQRLQIKHPLKYTQISHKLPSFLRFLSFIKSSEDSFFFSRDKISKMLEDKNAQFIFYEFFNNSKPFVDSLKDYKEYNSNIAFFKNCLEKKDFIKAAEYFMELYTFAYQYENLSFNSNYHDIELLHIKKELIDEFLHEVNIEKVFMKNQLNLPKDHDNNQNINYLYKNIPETKNSNVTPKVNWKKLLDK